ncbi:MAG: hypothetical protein KBA31_13440 [Alphaproteobacteria bacterium]|nr:hypothetical protein [Alphaproteobacteria bacterium]
MSAKTTRTPEGDALFLHALRSGQTVANACAAAHYVRSCVYDWRRDDAAFAAAWRDAVFATLEDAADRRLFDRHARGEARKDGHRRNHDALLFARYEALKRQLDELKAKAPAAIMPPSHSEAPAAAPRDVRRPFNWFTKGLLKHLPLFRRSEGSTDAR